MRESEIEQMDGCKLCVDYNLFLFILQYEFQFQSFSKQLSQREQNNTEASRGLRGPCCSTLSLNISFKVCMSFQLI